MKIQSILGKNDADLRQLSGSTLKNDLTGETIYTPPDDKETIFKLMKKTTGKIEK